MKAFSEEGELEGEIDVEVDGSEEERRETGSNARRILSPTRWRREGRWNGSTPPEARGRGAVPEGATPIAEAKEEASEGDSGV